MIYFSKKIVLMVLLVLIFGNIIAWLIVYDLSKLSSLEVTFFDVGQGDAIFIQTPKLHQILIDGGPDSSILQKLSKKMPFWDRSIDLIILTHPEKDHLFGLIEVVKRYKIKNILWTGVTKNTEENKEWEKLIQKEGAEIKIAQTVKKVILPKLSNEIDCGDGIIEILYPFENLKNKILDDSNNTSIVAKLTFCKNSFLFTGDIYKSVEKELLENKIDIDSDVLKVSHHGSKTSTSEKFIEKVSPNYAVISVGKNNKYGHPHKEVLEILENYDIRILRTDHDGDIKIISDGQEIKIR